jgi:hypothetical protein
MARRPAHRLLGLLLVPALLASTAAQGLLLFRCGPGAVRMSCCCPEKHAPPPAAELKAECCDKVAVPAADPRESPRQAPSAPEPQIALAPALPSAESVDLQPARGFAPGALEPPPRPSPVLTNCSWLN